MAEQITLAELSKQRKVGGPWTVLGVTLKRASDIKEVGSKGYRFADCFFVDEKLDLLDVQWGYPPANLAQMIGQSGTLLLKAEEYQGNFRYKCNGDGAFPAGEEKKFGGGKGGGWSRPEWKPSRELTGATADQMVAVVLRAHGLYSKQMGSAEAASAAVSVGIAFAEGRVWPGKAPSAVAPKPVATEPPSFDDSDIPF